MLWIKDVRKNDASAYIYICSWIKVREQSKYLYIEQARPSIFYNVRKHIFIELAGLARERIKRNKTLWMAQNAQNILISRV